MIRKPVDFLIPGLPQEASERIVEVCSKPAGVEKIILYGSRAKGNYRSNSDVDLTLAGEELTFSELLRLEGELDDLLLPWKIDLSLFHLIENGALADHIQRAGKILWER